MGSVLQMWNETNPTSLYLGTTWELISDGKYVKTGSTALQTGGSNSITLNKDNLPNTKVKVDSFSLTTQPHTHSCNPPNSAGTEGSGKISVGSEYSEGTLSFNTNSGGGQSTGSASPYTSPLGKGTAITIQPEFITLKFWKRTS